MFTGSWLPKRQFFVSFHTPPFPATLWLRQLSGASLAHTSTLTLFHTGVHEVNFQDHDVLCILRALSAPSLLCPPRVVSQIDPLKSPPECGQSRLSVTTALSTLCVLDQRFRRRRLNPHLRLRVLIPRVPRRQPDSHLRLLGGCFWLRESVTSKVLCQTCMSDFVSWVHVVGQCSFCCCYY